MDQIAVPEPVTCYSGSAYAERPVSFIWEGERHMVRQVIASWFNPEGKAFRVVDTGENIFELTWSQARFEWQIKPG